MNMVESIEYLFEKELLDLFPIYLIRAEELRGYICLFRGYWLVYGICMFLNSHSEIV